MSCAHALALPALLETLPPAFIPTRFSDFAFLGRLAATTGEQFKEWLLLRPAHIDLKAELLLMAQAGIFFFQSILCVILIRNKLTEAKQNFSRVARMEEMMVVVLPRFSGIASCARLPCKEREWPKCAVYLWVRVPQITYWQDMRLMNIIYNVSTP